MCPSLRSALYWQPALPDARDFRLDDERVLTALRTLSPPQPPEQRREEVDLREFCPPVRERHVGEAAIAHACVELVDYFRRRVEGELTPGSTRFVHQVAQLLAHQQGRARADVRTSLKAIVRFGIPPSSHEEAAEESFEGEPSPFMYASAENLRSLVYFRLDSSGIDGEALLARIKSLLAAGFPCLLGFPVPESVSEEADIPWRPTLDRIRGGQVVVVMGYDDRRIRWTKGSLLIRNSWGRSWGEEGYGWLPYLFVERHLVGDCWCVFSAPWLASNEFDRPQHPPVD